MPKEGLSGYFLYLIREWLGLFPDFFVECPSKNQEYPGQNMHLPEKACKFEGNKTQVV